MTLHLFYTCPSCHLTPPSALQELDKDLDLDLQMKYDPTGALTIFWDEQRRMLRRKKQTQWHPQVLTYCYYLWSAIGNKTFDGLRQVLILPSRRTLQIFKSRVPHGDGIRQEVCIKFQELWGKRIKRRKDRECILSWDATGC